MHPPNQTPPIHPPNQIPPIHPQIKRHPCIHQIKLHPCIHQIRFHPCIHQNRFYHAFIKSVSTHASIKSQRHKAMPTFPEMDLVHVGDRKASLPAVHRPSLQVALVSHPQHCNAPQLSLTAPALDWAISQSTSTSTKTQP